MDGDGLSIEDSWGPVWVEGTLRVVSSTTELASASYSITSGAAEPFES